MNGVVRAVRGAIVMSVLALTLSACVIGIDGTGGVSTASAVQVVFRVEAQGPNVNVERVSLRAGTFERTVELPALPWSLTVSARPGDTVAIAAAASAARGSTITLSYQIVEAGRVIGSGTRTCDQIGCPSFNLQGTVRR